VSAKTNRPKFLDEPKYGRGFVKRKMEGTEDSRQEDEMERIERWIGKKLPREGDIQLPNESGKRDPSLGRGGGGGRDPRHTPDKK
jgi:hypothetical protein